MLASVTSSEITLKGKNRRYFENALMRNIRSILSDFKEVSVTRKGTCRFLVSADAGEKEFRDALQRVFGVDRISFPREAQLAIEAIQETVLSFGLTSRKIKVHTRRSDKRFPMNSQQVNSVIGKALVDSGCSVDLDEPDDTIFIDLLQDRALVSLEKTRGPGGLPVGTSGKVLSLLSGGIDSPVASWLMMKRGCSPDFLHIHSFEKDVKKSKVVSLAKRLREYSPRPMRLFMAPYKEFYKASLSMDPKLELVLFRRFLLKLANRVARRRKHKGIVTGDSIGQVASQTLDNLMLVDSASALPVFRPLVAYNKDEIVELAIRIGTYEKSIEPYKDCCSLVSSRRPTTDLKHWEMGKKEEGLEDVVEKTFKEMEVIEI
jgi:thiamine biosynthesis protein ThiI